MKIKMHLSIGYPTADHEDILEIDDSELEGMTPEQRDEYLINETDTWANEYINYWYEEVE